MMACVTLRTERLVLRTPLEEDYPAIAAFMRSARTTFIGGPVEAEFDVWRGFLGTIGHWGLRGYGFFTVLRDSVPVGRVGLVNHIMWDEPELGWHLFEGHEGQGYATEAAIAARDWALRAHGLGRLISYIHPDNVASQRVAERLGASVERDSTLLGHPVQVWRHPEVPT
ncbi:GNAT family N-acetyltransferase [Thetidibacter halocola]|uniref:GNAT family N-acetyltransferase n=1 Tax=Thetidibacter halocola TaxID=2827239 RepID=A0A8J7WHM2_9RHOB|nr:GNAT family N-acetyltransferase [Thetidibacter halocola]MBS0125811.1 GNAT family N-acetyltransferase [Thetidibacter halocola]